MSDPSPRICLVTGASRGLGYAVARALGARGHQVIALARTVGGLEDLADEIEAAGGPTPTLVPLSMTDEGGLQRLCLAIHERWGRLDLAVHCAAHAPPLAPAAHLADKDFDQTFEVNVRGTERLIVYLAPLLGPDRPLRLPGRQPRRPAVLRRLRRLQGRRRGPGPLLRRRVREDRPPRHPPPPQPDAHRPSRPLLPRRRPDPPDPLRRRGGAAARPPPRLTRPQNVPNWIPTRRLIASARPVGALLFAGPAKGPDHDAPCRSEPAGAAHFAAPVRRPERASAEAEGRNAVPVALHRGRDRPADASARSALRGGGRGPISHGPDRAGRRRRRAQRQAVRRGDQLEAVSYHTRINLHESHSPSDTLPGIARVLSRATPP